MLLEGPSVFVHLDPRKPGVIVPERFMSEPQLMLQVGLNMAISIPDLKVDDDGITCTLSFRQRPFWCSMPWSAIYALVGEDNRGMVWPNDVPPEIATQLQGQSAAGPKPAPARKPRPKLAAVPSEPEVSEVKETGATDGTNAPEAATGTTRKKGRDEPKRGLSAVPVGPTARATRGASGGRSSRGGNAARIDDDEPPRPTLMAVPPAEPSGAGEKRGPMAPALASEDETTTPVPPRRPELVPGKKPKRELPPYLRVIK